MGIGRSRRTANFGSPDKFVFPVPPNRSHADPEQSPHHETTPCPRLSTTAAFAVLGGAIFAIEKARAFPVVPPPSSVVPAPGTLVKADDKMDVEKLKTDLAAANKKIEDLEEEDRRL